MKTFPNNNKRCCKCHKRGNALSWIVIHFHKVSSSTALCSKKTKASNLNKKFTKMMSSFKHLHWFLMKYLKSIMWCRGLRKLFTSNTLTCAGASRANYNITQYNWKQWSYLFNLTGCQIIIGTAFFKNSLEKIQISFTIKLCNWKKNKLTWWVICKNDIILCEIYRWIN